MGECASDAGEPLGIIRDPKKNRIIEIDIVNERIGLYRLDAATPDTR
jgi:hypothetical protein